MNYIKADDLINEVQINLHTYFQNGLVDSSILYPVIQRNLELIGVKILPKKSAVIHINNYVANLPKDFYSLIYALSTETKVIESLPIKGHVTYEDLDYAKENLNGKIIHEEAYEESIHKIISDSEFIEKGYLSSVDEFGRFRVIQKIDKMIYVNTATKVLSISHDSNIDSLCLNPTLKSNYDIELKNNKIFAKFQTGSIYIEYRTLLEEDGELLIPDYSEIKSWLIAECEKKIFQYLYYNGLADTVQRLQFSDKELHILRENARTFWKRHSYSDFVEMKKHFIYNFNRLSRS